jgi:hypothetical protein
VASTRVVSAMSNNRTGKIFILLSLLN